MLRLSCFQSMCLVLLGLCLSHVASAVTLTVSNLNDSGPGSLRDQVAAAASGDIVVFGAGVTGIIELNNPSISIAKDLTITGPGSGSLAISGVRGTPLAGDFATTASIFRIHSGIVGISGLTLRDGSGDGSGVERLGGAIFMTGGALTVSTCTLSGSSADKGGAIYLSGGSVATITSSTLSDNVATFGGAIHTLGASDAVTIRSSTLSANNAQAGGGVLTNGGPITITNSTFSGNNATGTSNGRGGGVFISGGAATITNSTITNNRGTLSGGGIFSRAVTMSMSNTIVSGNSVNLGGYFPDTDITVLTGTNNLIDQNPMLGLLADNGGPTKTHTLLASSPAANAGDPAFDTTNTPYDQRGIGYPRKSGGAIDIGALEVQVPTVTTPTSASLAVTTARLGGTVTSAGSTTITERGVVYAPTGTNPDPMIGGTGVVKATTTGTTGVFTVAVTGLTQATDYSFKAYAVNSLGTSYSSVATFTTTLPDPTGAAGLVVTTNSDVSANDGLITLREAVVYANSGNAGLTPEITFSVTGVVQLVGAAVKDLVINKNLTITGPGADSLTVKAADLYTVGIFQINSGMVSISGLKLSDGNGNIIKTYDPNTGLPSSNEYHGGAIYIAGGTVTLTNCTLSNNTANYGGAIYLAGGSLAVTGSTISGNNIGNGYGGGIYVGNGSLEVASSTISGNIAGWGGGLDISGGTATIANSTISGNTAKEYTTQSQPGYSYNGTGGGIYISSNVTVTVTNSTISGNRAQGTNVISGTNQIQPGAEGGGGICNLGVLTIVNSTVTANQARTNQGGGINTALGTLQLSNSILANSILINSANNTSNSDLIGNRTSGVSGNYNLVQSGATITGSNNIAGQAANLGALANSGGPTQTHALLAGSPAINAGSNALIASGVTTDQRGAGFARIQGGTVDIGAWETQILIDTTPPTMNISAPSVTLANSNSSVTYTVTYGDANFSSSTLSASNVTLNRAGTINASVSVTSSSVTTRTVTLSEITGYGTLGISIVAGTATDSAGNTAPAAGPSSTFTVNPSVETVQRSGTIRAAEGGGFAIGYIGNPGQEYTIQFSPDLLPPWQTLGTQAANSSGVISIVDNPPPGTPKRFYRLLMP